MKDKKNISITNLFKILLDEVGKPNRIWIDKGSEIYNRSVKALLEDNDIEIYSTHNKQRSVAAEIFIKKLRWKL